MEQTHTAGGVASMNNKIKFKKKQIEVGSLSICLPIIELGNHRGKSLAITCGVHGNEATSILLMAELIKRVKNEKLNGNIKIILLANPLASLFNSRVSPLDYQDLNRIAPGNPNGTCSERVCRMVLEEILSQEYFIDLHEWPKTKSMIQGIVINDPKDSTSVDMLGVFNPQIKLLLDTNCYSNSVYAFAHNKKNKKGFALEIPNSNIINSEDKKRIVDSLINVIKYLGILNTPSNSYSEENLTISKAIPFTSHYNGIFYPQKKLGEKLQKNSQIGYILEYDLKTKHILKNSIENTLLINLAPNTIVNVGDLLYVLGEK